MVDDPELEVDIQGISIPWWLASQPDQVTTVEWKNEIGEVLAALTFEAFALASGSFTIHCTYPRHASMLTQPDPDTECHWTHTEWDEQAMIEHSRTHLQQYLT